MRRRIALFWMAVLMGIGTSLSAAVTYCASSAFGYSTATGGSGTPVLVSSVDGLKKELNKANNKIIIITANLTFTKMLTVQDGSNVTLLGLPGVTLTSNEQTASTSGILYVKRFNNIIIRNLTFVGPGAYDCDGNDLLCFEDVTNAWVDHCDFQDGCDGNFDNKHKTDNVTVSWCRFRYLKAPKPGGSGGSDDHRFTNLLGAKSSDAPSDGTYNFTWAYCWWDDGCKERMVRCRNAELHFLNCYWNSSVANYYVGPENAKAYFEGCTFEGKANSSSKIFKSYGGTNACKFIDCSGNLPSATGSVSAPTYTYTASGREEAKTAVTNASCGAGATLTVTPAGGVSSTCDGGAAPVPTVKITWAAATNGGTCATSYSIVESGSEIGSLPNAEKSGSTFDGWFTSASGGDQIFSTTVVSADVTYYAHFTKISGGGGACIEWAGDPNSLTENAITVDTDLKLTAGGGITLASDKVWNGSGNVPLFKINNTGHYIEGHFVDDSGISSVTISAANNQNAGIARKYVVVFSPNSDFTTSSTLTVYEYAAPSYKDARDDSKLIHEFVAPEGTMYFRIYRKFTIGGTYGDDKQTRVYGIEVCKGPAAVPSVPTLSYENNGGSGTMVAAEGPDVTVDDNGFTAPSGYSFKEWNTIGNGNGSMYAPGTALTLTEDLTLYAIWQPQTYTVTLQANGGTGGTTSVSATFDEAMPEITVPTRSGYVFLGYFTGADGTGTQYYDGNGSSTSNWMIASNTTLNAYWEEESSTPDTGCDLLFWFPNAADAETNGVTQNEGSFFKSMITTTSTQAGSITIDGKSYTTTKRSGDKATFGKFTIPIGKTGIFYALAVSSGAGDRQINLVCGSATYELPVEGGSSSYKRIESDVLPAGTYNINREGSSNVRLGIIVVKLCATEVPSTDKTVYLKPGTNWRQKDGSDIDPRFAVYYFKSANPGDNDWISMTKADDCAPAYKAVIPDGYDKCIFCRMNGATTENNFNTGVKYNQTSDLDVPSGNAVYYTVPDGAWDNEGSWSERPFGICVAGTWLRFTGENITLNATCSGANYFQWYKDGTAIDGAIDATYTKGSCSIADAGNYSCKAWTVAGQEVTSETIGVKVPYLNIKTGRWGSDDDIQRIALIRADEETEMASGSLHLGVGWDYGFFISDGLENHGQNNGDYYLADKLNSDNCTDWDRWIMNDLSNRCVMRTTKEGTYTFTIKFSKDSWTPIKVNVTYPPMVQIADRPIYMEKTSTMAADEWNKIYYRIGKGNQADGDDENWATAYEMTLVPGTARYYQTTTDDWGNDFWAWHIGNNVGDAGSKSSIYKTNSGDGSKEITRSINFSGDEILDPGWTIYLTGEGSWGGDWKNDHCKFFSYTHTDGMLTHNISIGATDHGKIKVEYTHHDGSSQTSEDEAARTLTDLAHTCILKITAVPDCGYEIATLKINGEDFTSGTEYILASDGKTVTATFKYAKYSVKLHENGGTIKPGEEVTGYTFPIGVTLPVEITYTGHEFLGWFDNEGCTGTPVTDILDGDCGDKEYWAKWVLDTPTPVFKWTYDETIKAGGVYPVKVETTGDADVTLSIVETIAGVTGSFTAGKPATGTVTLGSYPAATTFTYQAESPATLPTYKAKTETKTVTIERCVTADILPYDDSPIDAGGSAKPRYFCEASGVGRIMRGMGSSSISGDNYGTEDFSGEAWATKYFKSSDHTIQAYQEDVFKIVFYVKSGSSTTIVKDLRYSDDYKENSEDWTDIKESAQVIYNDNPAATSLTKNEYETLTIIPSSPMKKDGWLYFKLSSGTQVWGAKLYRPEGDEPTSVEFSGEAEIEKYPGDAPFTNAATQTTTPVLSGGSITYKSSDETVATVDANTGEVTILDIGHTNITATLGAFGCFEQSTASYSLTVKKCTDPLCTIAVTSGKANKCSSDDVTLTASAATGATFQWYKNGAAISGETGSTFTTKDAGEYYVEARKECLQVSNTITVTNFTAPTATALHDYYYIRAGRVTPDIALFQLTNVAIGDPTAFSMNHEAPLGCHYELREDGIVYLVGVPDESLTVTSYDLTVTAHNACGFADATATMNLRQIIEGKIAWVGCGSKGAGPADAIPTSQSTDHTLYQYLENYFDLVPVNAYWTTDEAQIKDYYSQFDLVLLTDYPNTHVTPSSDHGKTEDSYSNALGCLIDEKPILTFEAYVAGCPNWGINTNPKDPNPKQKDMTLLCSAHNIFAGTTISVEEKITFLSSISGEGLQGFTGLEAPPGMLFIATIENKESNGGTLVVCCERQKVIEARMMIMGLNYEDMGNVTPDGKLIIKQIINYLLQYEELADCSIVFDDKNETHIWSDPQNWYPTYNAVPKPMQAVRVDKPCNVDVTNAHCSSIRLRKDGANGWNGTLTILPDAGLTVMDYIKEVHGTNFMTTYPSAASDLVIQAGENGQNGSLVFGNTEDDLQATVEYFSLAKDAKTSSPVWQYIGIPITDKPMAIDAYHAAWMCSWESEGNVSSNWVWVENEDRVQPFKGYCITQQDAKKYTHIGSLSRPETKALPLYYFESDDGDGFNMFANSWVAPIDISKIEADDFGGSSEPTIFIYNTGTRAEYEGGGSPSTTGQNTGAGQFNAIPVNAAPYLPGALTKIPTMQGFFVQATKEGTLMLDYKKLCFNTETYATTAETMRAPKRVEEEPADEPVMEKIVPEVMRLDVVSAKWSDRLYILTHHEFSDAFDRGWDGSKQEGDEKAPMLALVRGNGLLAVAAVETSEERELLFRAGEDTEYTFSFAYEGERIYLYDRLAGKATEIKTGNTYSFTADNETAVPRFLITKNPPQVPTDIEQLDNGQWTMDNARKLIIDGVLYILRDNRFYDARGVRVTELSRKGVTP